MGYKLKCPICKDMIQSMHRDDIATCTCSNIWIRGGDSFAELGFHKEPGTLLPE